MNNKDTNSGNMESNDTSSNGNDIKNVDAKNFDAKNDDDQEIDDKSEDVSNFEPLSWKYKQKIADKLDEMRTKGLNRNYQELDLKNLIIRFTKIMELLDKRQEELKNDQRPRRRCSRKQKSANRKNGKLGGPKTNSGKRVVGGNAIKHGLLAQEIVIHELESIEDFDDQYEKLLSQYQPVGFIEEMLVKKIMISVWRLKRVGIAEIGMILKNHGASDEEIFQSAKDGRVMVIEACELRDMIPREEDCKNLLRYETTIERQFYRALDQLERMQRARKGEMVPAPINVNVIAEKE